MSEPTTPRLDPAAVCPCSNPGTTHDATEHEQTPADTRPDHTDTIARVIHAGRCDCGKPVETDRKVAAHLLDPSNRATLLAAIGVDHVLDTLTTAELVQAARDRGCLVIHVPDEPGTTSSVGPGHALDVPKEPA